MLKFRSTILIIILMGLPPGMMGVARAQPKDEAHAESVKQGLFFYEQFCILCHGPNGMGSFIGPSLTSGRAKSLSAAAIRTTIADGTRRGMPSFGRGLSRDEMDSLVNYLKSLHDRPSRRGDNAPKNPHGDDGDYKAGEDLFYGKANCSDCHSVTYRGGMIGPDLSHIASEKEAGEIFEAITDPARRVTSQYKLVEFTADGKNVRGMFRAETPESIQVLNAEGNLWTTYMKSEITGLKKLRESLMPAGLLDELSDQEKTDLMTFLTMQE